MIISIGYVNKHNIKIKTIIDKKDFNIVEDRINDYVKGSYQEFSTMQLQRVYYIYLNDFTHIKVSKEFYNNVNIGYSLINE
jgi:hypothetical protein